MILESKSHLTILDGLKGVSILAVIFTHIPIEIWFGITPPISHWLVGWIVSCGGVAVTIFFLISGFLMGYLYPEVRSPISFYIKRYEHIFPPFFVIVTTLLVIQSIKLPFWGQIFVLIGLAFLVFFIRKRKGERISKKVIMKLILVIQAIVAIGYAAILLRIPSQIFYTSWSKLVQKLISYVINLTLTLPFGNYVGQMDGVYWTLVAEVLFYLLYPILIAPLIQRVGISFRSIVLFFISLFLFSFGFSNALDRVLGFQMLRSYLIIYFIVGVWIGMNKERLAAIFSKITILKNPLLIFLLGVLSFSSVPLSSYIPDALSRIVTIGMVAPISLWLICLISIKNPSSLVMNTGSLRFFGRYSYVMFLAHSLAIHMVTELVKQNSIFGKLSLVVGSVALTAILGWILSYFTLRKVSNNHSIVKVVPKPSKGLGYHERVFLMGVSVFLIIYFSYKPPFALFTYVETIGGGKGVAEITEKEFSQSFNSHYDGLGMLVSSMHTKFTTHSVQGFVESKLLFVLEDINKTVVAEGKLNAYEILDDRFVPFGFPILSSSKGKSYHLSYKVSPKNPTSSLYLDRDEYDLMAVYIVDKKYLFTHPVDLVTWINHKVAEPFQNKNAIMTLFLCLPFILYWFYHQKSENLSHIDSYKSE